MEIIYRTNGVITTTSLTNWYFGTKTVNNLTNAAKSEFKKTGKREFKFWQDGTGYLTIEIH